jgi:hypothetical protein
LIRHNGLIIIIIIITVFIKRQIAKGYKALRRNEEGKRQNKDKDDQLRRGKKVGFESTFEGWDTVGASGKGR